MDRSWHADSTLLAHFRRRGRKEGRKKVRICITDPVDGEGFVRAGCLPAENGLADGMGRDGMGTRFLQLVVRNPILQLSCLEISLLLSPSAASRAHVALRKT